MHLHADILQALTMFAYLLIITALWRQAAAQLSDRPLGKAMAAIY